jgi:outer membrane receptor protein involved in Fe transport
VNAGTGFHSNDARGVLTRRDPSTLDSVPGVDPLVRLSGAEIGVRTEAMSQWVHTLSLWYLESDSELVYVGDAGTNEAGPGSRRYGVELANYWRPTSWVTFDSELTWTHARFRGVEDAEIPGSVPVAWSGGVTIGQEEGFFGSLRGRYFSPRPLEESGEIESRSSLQVNARLGYRRKSWEVAIDCLNLLDRDDRDIEYFYESRLAGEAEAGVADVHFHPAEPRTFRISLAYRF